MIGSCVFSRPCSSFGMIRAPGNRNECVSRNGHESHAGGQQPAAISIKYFTPRYMYTNGLYSRLTPASENGYIRNDSNTDHVCVWIDRVRKLVAGALGDWVPVRSYILNLSDQPSNHESPRSAIQVTGNVSPIYPHPSTSRALLDARNFVSANAIRPAIPGKHIT